jgi:hypothetical protein
VTTQHSLNAVASYQLTVDQSHRSEEAITISWSIVHLA